MQSLVIMQENQPITTSLIIAEGTENQHKNVMELVRNYLEDLEEFGRVAFETRSFETEGGIQHREVAMLNEQQATYLITLMRNSEIVRQFKKALVKAFFQMRDALRTEPDEYKRVDITTQHIRGVTNPNGLDITYTLNLTHFVRKPTTDSLELIQRLTGIDLESTSAYQKAAQKRKQHLPVVDYFTAWFNACCTTEDNTRVLRRELYVSFESWFCSNVDIKGPLYFGLTRQKMGNWFAENGIRQEMRGGQNIVLGVSVN